MRSGPSSVSGSRSRDAAGWAASAAVCLATIVAPLVLGGTHVLAIAGLDAVMATVICLWAAFFRPSLTQLAVPLACLTLPFLQLVPLPDRLLVALAPVSAGAWKVAHAGMPNAWGRISIDPAETAASARHAFLALGTVMAVAELATRSLWRYCLAAALAASGVIIWMLGLAFPVKLQSFLLLGFIDFKGPLMPGRTPLLPPVATAGFGYPELVRVAGEQYAADSWIVGDGFGSYLVTNHFAGAITLTIPFLVAVWLCMSRKHLAAVPRIIVAIGFFAGAAWTLAWLVQSRAGTASFVMATLVFACFTAPAGWCRRIAVTVTGIYAAMLVGFLVVLFGPFHDVDKLFPADIQPRIAALLTDGRVVATRVAERMFLASPLCGTGLGTYGDLYPVMTHDTLTLYFAHNEYAQLLAETGFVGLALLVAMSMPLGRAATNFWRTTYDADRPLHAAAWAAVSGLAMHSCFDWNLRVPANLFLFCVAAGLSLASARRIAGLPHLAQPRSRAILFAAGLTIVLNAAVTGLSFRDTASEVVQRRLREAIVAARLDDANRMEDSPRDALVLALAAGERMARWDPHDAQLAVALGQANLHLSTSPMPIDDANACLERAAMWFCQARWNCAACRGLAEQQVLGATDAPPR